MKYIHKKTGAAFETNCELRGEMWGPADKTDKKAEPKTKKKDVKK